MDPLTHTATGLLLGRAGLNRFSPHAPWILALAANAPDIDIVTLAGGQLSYLNYHRHLTHSLIAWPVMALLPVVLVRLFSRRPLRWLGAYAMAFVAVGSHLLLDYTNSYGVRFLLPFSARWFHLDITNVVDLWIWAVLLLAFAGPALVRLVNTEIGAGAGHAARSFAIFALMFVALYDGGRAVLHARAVAMLNSRIYAGAAPRRTAAFPGPANPLAWRGLVDTGDSYIVFDESLLREFDPAHGEVFYKAEASPVVKAANSSPVFRDFFNFSQFPIEQVMPVAASETRVVAMDMRFGSPARPAFVATADVSDTLRVVRAWFTFAPADPSSH